MRPFGHSTDGRAFGANLAIRGRCPRASPDDEQSRRV